MSNYKMVYSTDQNVNSKLKLDNLRKSHSENSTEIKVDKFTPVLKIEKSGRGGKTVTVIEQLPKNDEFLKKTTTELKKSCGTGGTYILEDGVIEIQGDKRDAIRKFFEKKKITCRGM